MNNKPLKIMQYFKKADCKLLSHLSSTEKNQAAQEFKSIWEGESSRVSAVINRRNKVKSNQSKKQIEQKQKTKQIALDLNSRMKAHAQKRSTIQLQKLQNYQSIDRTWKRKVKTITENQRLREESQFSRIKALNKQIQQFWQKKKSPKTSKVKLTQAISHHNSTPFNQYFINKKSQSPQQVNFLTEVRASQPKSKNTFNRQSRSVQQNDFPDFDKNKGSNIQKSVNRSQLVRKHRTQTSRACLQKLNEQRREKQDQFFQHAMQKINKIMIARGKVVEKLKLNSQQVKQHRIQRQRLFKRHLQQISRNSPLRQVKNKSFDKMSVDSKRSLSYQSNKSSQVRLRRRQLEEQSYRLRTEVYDKEREKQHRGRFHRMVKDAVNIYKFQALRQKQ